MKYGLHSRFSGRCVHYIQRVSINWDVALALYDRELYEQVRTQRLCETIYSNLLYHRDKDAVSYGIANILFTAYTVYRCNDFGVN